MFIVQKSISKNWRLIWWPISWPLNLLKTHVLTTAGNTWLIWPVTSNTITDVDMVRVTAPENEAAPTRSKIELSDTDFCSYCKVNLIFIASSFFLKKDNLLTKFSVLTYNCIAPRNYFVDDIPWWDSLWKPSSHAFSC